MICDVRWINLAERKIVFKKGLLSQQKSSGGPKVDSKPFLLAGTKLQHRNLVLEQISIFDQVDYPNPLKGSLRPISGTLLDSALGASLSLESASPQIRRVRSKSGKSDGPAPALGNRVSRSLKCFSPIAILVLIILGFSPTLFGNEADETLKSYLHDSPSIKSLIFRRRVLSVPHIPGSKVPDSVTNYYRMYEGAWQPNAFFLRELRDMKDRETLIDKHTFTADLLISGRNNYRWWDLLNNQMTSWTETPNEKSSPIRPKVQVAEDLLDSVVHLGISGLKPNTLKWQDKHFTAQTKIDQNIEGALTALDGVPTKIDVRSSGNKAISYVCEYEYSNSPPDRLLLPSKIHRYTVKDGVKTPIWVIDILQMEIANDNIRDDYFDPERFVVKTNVETYVYTNSLQYKLVSNAFVWIPGTRPPTVKPKPGRFTVLMLFFITTLTFALLVRSKTQTQKH